MQSYNDMKQGLVGAGIKELKDISLLVLNAGVLNSGTLEKISTQEALAVAKVNMYHPTAMLKVFLPILTEREGQSGVIVVSSTMGYVSMPACSAYAASKAYLNNLTLAVEHELQAFKQKVDVLLYTPNFV